MLRGWRLAALVGAAVFVCGALLPTAEGIRVSPFDVYGEAIADGRVPYRDFSLEYPPWALPPVVVPALVPYLSYPSAFRAVEALLGVLLVACTAYLLRDVRRAELAVRVGLVALLPVLLGGVVLHRFDLWPALLVSASLVAVERGRSGLAAGLLGLAAAAKVYGAALASVLLSFVERRDGPRATWTGAVALVGAGLLVTAPLAAVAPGGVAASIERQLERPLQIESLGASLLLFLGSPTPEFVSGSWSLTGSGAVAVGTISTALGLIALAAVWAVAWRYRRRLDTPRIAYALCVAVVLVFGKVASPQFLVWLAPLVAVVRGGAGLAACGVVAGACVLTQLVYPSRYDELVAGETLPAALLVARNALLVAAAAILAGALWRRVRRPDVRVP